MDLKVFELEFAYAHGRPEARADFRVEWDDFVVDEDLGFTPEGAGEHIYLRIQKRGVNTEWLAKQLARFAEVKLVDVGFCGMKDRHAKTTQWFSIYKPKGEVKPWGDFADFVGDDVAILQVTRGSKKLRRGDHAANRFAIRLRNLTLSPDDMEGRLRLVQALGVPNYFGEQRFGHGRQNLAGAAAWLADMRAVNPKSNRSIWMSAMRSFVFNRVLHQRILSAALGDIASMSGPLWGRGHLTGDQAHWELSCLDGLANILNGLEHCGLSQERRKLWLDLAGFEWELDDAGLLLRFTLGAGEYATAVLRELACVTDRSVKSHAVSLEG